MRLSVWCVVCDVWRLPVVRGLCGLWCRLVCVCRIVHVGREVVCVVCTVCDLHGA